MRLKSPSKSVFVATSHGRIALRLAPFDRKGQAGGSPHREKQGGNAFLDATPGARRIVILSSVDLLNQFEQVIVDLPASGHALGILRFLKQHNR